MMGITKNKFVRIVFQDFMIIAGYFLVICLLDGFADVLPNIIFGILFLILWAVVFLLIFFSNAELFKSVKNNYLWVILTTLITLFILIPVVVYSVHNPCFI